ncbi:MAG: 6-methylpretetramide 4-monooxygenase [Chroococcidiopsis sp. SAG 2025]|uniref:FAD-dependent oxidoreductase n=1 Tax=Chroococcidiopsis sp. SAG 2025 TaxID=171389 RepID=UPI00293748DF|nr:FAD-dependent oxidoreductase [Chroococcidiopsis sp. SAG 2025]MDV2990807.1 6-methylpretetramide 4-monooxygenase [Chroococcidiopsis sp. SAG 2025]
MTNDTQVVIVGAGPTGATLALLLAKRGITVKLVEASRNFRRAFRGEGLMPSGLDALEQMGLSSMLERIPHQTLDAWEFLIEGRSLFRVDEPIESGGKPCTLVSQPALLEALIAEAIAYPNFEFVQNAPVQDLLWRDERISGVKLGSGEIYADLVVAADGRNSIVRQQAHLSLEQKSQSFDILWFKLADSPHFDSENIFYSILQGHHAFGLFRSSEGNLQLGWALREHDAIDWKQVDDWSEILASASPPWLAEHFRQNAKTIDRPVLLSVVVGRCSRWYAPGLLLLGDAAHPMSPIRAQGINMALRDIIVTANHLVPLLREAAEHTAIDAALPKIQAEREPEIIRVQKLQAQEAAQADLLEKSAIVRWGASQLAPLLRYPVRQSWIARQRQLRQGVTRVELTV